MKLRHAAALALLVWYLMVPPAVWPTQRLDFSVPIPQWIVLEGFDTGTACEAYLQDLKEDPEPLNAKFKLIQDMGVPKTALRAARCIFHG
ncbi:MAG: hypothetical protein ACLQAT_00945 [Candidatus Binataceae bacterium]